MLSALLSCSEMLCVSPHAGEGSALFHELLQSEMAGSGVVYYEFEEKKAKYFRPTNGDC